jgi:hypothetical protein
VRISPPILLHGTYYERSNTLTVLE